MHQSSQGTEQIVGVKGCDAILQFNVLWEWLVASRLRRSLLLLALTNLIGLVLETDIEMMSCSIRIWFGCALFNRLLIAMHWRALGTSSSWEDRCCSQFSEIASKCHLTRLLYLHQNILWGFWDESYQSCTKVKVDIFGRHGVEWLTQDRKRGRRGAGWQKLRGSTGGTRRKVWTRTKILSPNIRYFVAN